MTQKKIRRHLWKDRLKNSKIAEFESDRSLLTCDYTAPQSCENLQTFVSWGQVCAPYHTNVFKISRILKSCIFVSFQQIAFKLGNFINFKALFYVVSTDFPELSIHVKSWKKTVNRSFQLIWSDTLTFL